MKMGKAPHIARSLDGEPCGLEISDPVPTEFGSVVVISLIHLYDLVHILLFQPHLVIQERLYIKGVLFVEICGQLEQRMLRQVVLVRQEWPDASELQDTLAAVQDSKLID